MSKIIFSIAVAFIFSPVFVFAQEENEAPGQLVVGETVIEYTEDYGITNGRLYYDEISEENLSKLVASTHDTNGDEKIDIWLVYNDSEQVVTEAYDTDGNEVADVILTLDANGEVVDMSGDGSGQYTREVPSQFIPEQISVAGEDTDFIGDLSDVTIAHEDNNWIFFVILLVVGVLLYFFWKRQK